MTTLQTRPSTPRPAPGGARSGPTGRSPRVRRRLTTPLAAGLAGAGVALGGLVVFWAVALTGWFLADGGAHGTTRDALRVGADAWLVGHGAHLTYAGVDYTVVPLGLTLLLAWAAYRAGRWAGSSAPLVSEPNADGEDPEPGREMGRAVVLLGAGYLVVAVVTAVLAGTEQARGSLVLATLGALVVGVAPGCAGLLIGTGRWDLVGDHLPGWVWPVLRSALAAVVTLLGAAALVVVASFVLHVGAASSLVSRLDLSGGDAVMLVVLSALLAPNAVALGAAYVVGPGFAIGTGTTVSPGVVALGPVPAFPMLAALPDDGATGWIATATMVLPPLAAAVGVALAQRRHPVRSWDYAALRGVGAGVLAGFLTGLVTALGGGALGDGRMADIGAPTAQVMASAALSMGLGGLLGALVMTFVQRRQPVEDDEPEEPGEPSGSADERPVVVVPARPDEQTVHLDARGVATTPPGTPGTSPDGLDTGSGLRELRARFLRQTRGPTPSEPDPDSGSDPDSEDTVAVERDRR